MIHLLEAVMAGAALFWLVLPLFTLIGDKSTNSACWGIFIAVGGAAMSAAALISASMPDLTLSLPHPLSLGDVMFSFRFTPLTDSLLLIVGATAVIGSPYIRGYMTHLSSHVDMRLFWICYSLLLASMCAVTVAGNVQTFLVAWEIMSLSSFFLVATDHALHKTRRAAIIYLGATRTGTALLAGGFLWAHAISGSWSFVQWHFSGVTSVGPGLLILAGLGVKAGMWPFHLWLPIAHPSAPAPVSAIMSGIMVKVAIIVLIKLFVINPAFQNSGFGYVLLLLGAVGAAWGILFALVQQDIKRMLALSTVENVGLILLSVGASIVTRSLGLVWASDLALAGAIFHMLNHAVFKYVLFLGAGAVDFAAGTRDLDLLGGLGRRMPVTFLCFLIGAASICALPPLCGFAGEWLLYQSALTASWYTHDPLIRFAGLLAVASLALIGTLVCASFIRTIGIAFQGRPRSDAAAKAKEVDNGMLISMAALSALCAVLGVFAPLVLHGIQFVIGPNYSAGQNIASCWKVPLLPSLAIFIATAAAAALWIRSRRSVSPERIYITWDCGFGEVGPRVQATSISFAQPVVRMFSALFNYAQTMQLEGLNARLFPLEVTSEATVDHPLEHHVYGPMLRWMDKLSDKIVELQTGSIHIYLVTMLVTLALLLIVGGYLK